MRQWHPDTRAKRPAEQVHLISMGDTGIEWGIRFKGPDTLGTLIEVLIAHRKQVWPEAPPIDPDVEIG